MGLAEFSEDVSAAASRASSALFSSLKSSGGAVAKAVSTRRAEAKEGDGRGTQEGGVAAASFHTHMRTYTHTCMHARTHESERGGERERERACV